jgi:hypothetical protein
MVPELLIAFQSRAIAGVDANRPAPASSAKILVSIRMNNLPLIKTVMNEN